MTLPDTCLGALAFGSGASIGSAISALTASRGAPCHMRLAAPMVRPWLEARYRRGESGRARLASAVADGLGYFRVLRQIFFLVEFIIELSFYRRSRSHRFRRISRSRLRPDAASSPSHFRESKSLGHQRTSSNEEMRAVRQSWRD